MSATQAISSGGFAPATVGTAIRPAYTRPTTSASTWMDYGTGRAGPGISGSLYNRQVMEGQAAAGGVPGARSAMDARQIANYYASGGTGSGRFGAGTGYDPNRAAMGYGGFGGGLAGSYQSAYDEARAENERRYGEILGGYNQRYGNAMGLLEGQGEQARADLASRFADTRGRQAAYLNARGLGGTTLAPTIQQGLASEEQSARGRLDEALRREKLGYMTGLSGDTLQFMERRTDAYPDYNQLQQLAYMQGQAGGAGGGGLAGGTIFHQGLGSRGGFAGQYGKYPGGGQTGIALSGVNPSYPTRGL